MKLHIVMLLVGAITALSVVNCAAGSIALVKNGQPAVDIVVPDGMNPVEKWAAEDLALYLGKMARATFEPVPESQFTKDEGKFVIYVGATAPGQALLAEAGELGPDEFIMAGGTDSGQLVIIGRDEPYDPEAEIKKQNDRGSLIEGIGARSSLGTCRGVWYLLRNYGGVRWYIPGEIGEEVPSSDTLSLPASVRVRKAPDFQMRDLRAPLNRTSLDFTRWYFRVGYGWAGAAPWANHSHHWIGPAIKESGHNEFYAMYDGKTNVRTSYPVYLCLNAPGLPAFWADQVVKYFEDNPLPPGSSYPISPADGYSVRNICECPLCILDKREGERREARHEHEGFQNRNYCSHYVFPIVAKVAALVKERVPDHFISCIAYANYGQPPQNVERFPDNVGIQICKARHGYTDPTRKEAARAKIRAWAEKCQALSVWEYYLQHYWARPEPMVVPHLIAEDLQWLKGKSLGEQIEVYHLFNRSPLDGGYLGMNGLTYYVTGRFLEDADQDIEQVLAEYFDRYYGPAAKTIQSFYRMIEEEAPYKPQAGSEEDWYDVEFARQALNRLHNARQQVPDDSKYATRIDMLIYDYQPWLNLVEQKMNPPAYRCRKAQTAPQVDGELDEACWDGADQIPLYLTMGYAERGGFPDTMGIDCRMVHTTDALWVGARVPSDADRKNRGRVPEQLEVALCSPEGRRYVLTVVLPRKVQSTVYAPGADESEEWPVDVEVADNSRYFGNDKNTWQVEVKLPLADLGTDPLASGWRMNVKLRSWRMLKSPLIWAEPIMSQRRGNTRYVLTWQPEAKGFSYNPKYYGTLQFE